MYLGFSFWTTIILIAIIMGVLQGTCAYLILLERKVAAWTQDRLGPNRVGPWGLLQPIADGIKFVLKEQVITSHVDRIFYLLGPAVAITTATLAFAVVPFGPTTPPPVLLDHRAGHPVQPVWPQTKAEEAAVLDADRKYAQEHGTKTYEERLAEYNNTLQFVIAPHVDIGIVFVFAIGSLAVYGIVLG